MKMSARNQLKGTVVSVESGMVVSKVVVKVGDIEVVSVVTKDAVEDLDIKVGDDVYAMMKATEVMIMK
jgi:molybdopterin-binding protein